MAKIKSLQIFIAFVLLGLPIVFVFQNCGQRTNFTIGNEISIVAGQSFCVVNPGDPVCTPPADVEKFCYFNNDKYSNGQSVESFQNSSVPSDQQCIGATRTCKDGQWTGLGSTFNYASCSVGEPADCLFDGQQIENGQSVKVYQNSTVPFGEDCKTEEAVCYNGVLKTDYKYSSCTVGGPTDCLFDGKQIQHGDHVEAFKVVGETHAMSPHYICDSEKRQCLNGILTGDYPLSSCHNDTPTSCLFNGKTVAHGETITAFETLAVKDTEKDCKSEPRTCINGELSGTFPYSSCGLNTSGSCTFNGKPVANGETITAAKEDVIEYDETKKLQQCEYQKRTCIDGVLSGEYEYETCEVQTPPILPPHGNSCVVTVSPQAGSYIPSWQLIIHNNTTTVEKYYTTNKASDNASKKCEAETITCTNGKASSREEVFSGCIEDTQPTNICDPLATVQGDMKVVIQRDRDGSSTLEFGTFADNYWLGSSLLGQVYDRKVEFEITDKNAIQKVSLDSVAFDDWMSLKVNGQLVYVGPYGGDRLELISGVEDNKRHFNRTSNKVQYSATDKRNVEQGRSWIFSPYKDLLPYLVNGKNVIEMKVIVAGAGEGAMKVRFHTSCAQHD